MVKDHSDSERGNLLTPHGLLFLISNKGYFICIIPDRIIHTTAFVTPVVEHWLEREIAQWVHPMNIGNKTNRTMMEIVFILYQQILYLVLPVQNLKYIICYTLHL